MSAAPINSRTGQAAAERWRVADEAARAQAQGRRGIAALASSSGHPLATLRRWARIEYLRAVQRAGGHSGVVRARAQALAVLAQTVADPARQQGGQGEAVRPRPRRSGDGPLAGHTTVPGSGRQRLADRPARIEPLTENAKG
jgi:hypothetical protein